MFYLTKFLLFSTKKNLSSFCGKTKIAQFAKEMLYLRLKVRARVIQEGGDRVESREHW